MIENSAAGLAMVLGEVTVTVTGEERHQSALARYRVAAGAQRRVAVELVWCTIRTGKYRGQHAIEVRLDGHRVGELTYPMSRRYAPLVTQIAGGGGRPGCEAMIERTAKGLELTLRLPRAAEGAVAVPQVPSVPRRGIFASHRPAWIAAAIVAIVFFAAMAGTDDDPSPSSAATDQTTTTTTTTEPTTTAPTTTTTTPKPVPKPAAPKPVVPKPVIPKPAVPKPAKPPAPAPPPASTCDPNYSGCVPVASDVDCAGGSGNGPAYATGPVEVIGTDVYDLDRDADGIACE